ncbi:NHLP family bacteriocin export ABC transporter peptidase/permease/ATPase subunit [Emergencia timonensis]|uniref:NHLP family bacteriocin export ABC transporter peptidase/permease/ATPase subunit n=1 Tax=Emergencia timonensis TaxID=1776384 RepID=UPI00082EF584|nr:NHLP family bacteriocin export ABC transporter peptidase/permease/ATPase subunit [Emergencia timonensis]WNX87533.1 NHLP family bacteriocin export ABC transporter peptidase/permease/ATPase subunit [Emergencia timonensis]
MAKPIKVPVVMQMEALECGAASLAMILAYHGRIEPLEKVRMACGVSRDGTSVKAIKSAAAAYGLTAKAFRYELDMAQDISFPAIIHWNFNHFVVLCGFTKKGAVINDPARGRVTVSMKEFDQAFTGVVIMFEKNDDFEAGGEKHSVMNFARKRLRGTRSAIIFVFITTVFVTVVGIVQPLFSKVFMDSILTKGQSDWLTPFIGIMAIVLAFSIVVNYLQAVYLRKIQGKFAVSANSEFMWHVLRLPMHFFSQRNAGDLVGRQGLNQSITNTLVGELAPAGLDLLTLVLYLTIMLKYSVILTAVGLVTVAINLFSAGYISNKIMNISRVAMRERGKVDSTTTSGIEMIETIKAAGAESGFFERWSGFIARESVENNRVLKTNIYMNSIPQFLTSLANSSVLLIGALLIINGDFTVGMLMAFQGFIAEFLSPALSLINVGTTVQQMRASMERVEDVMEYPADVDYTKDEKESLEGAKKLSGDIRLKDVTFGYSTNSPALIKDFSIDIKPGSKVAFVGGSGCGKSTMTKLISGLYKPWSGTIEFDGKPMEELNHMIFTSSVAVVDQDIIMFEDSIRNNIKMWDQSIEDFEMIMAAKDASMHEEIMLREGYDCKLTEGGKNFSGGQRQRLEIARVLAQDPSIVIMDEATSALDAKTEYEVINAIKDRGITCIIVAHRLSTIRDCDEIVVMNYGEVVERGTHEELMAKGGLYTQLITTE